MNVTILVFQIVQEALYGVTFINLSPTLQASLSL